MRELAARGVNEIMVEAGRRLCGALLAADLVDEIIVYQAPLIFGADARDLFAVAPPPQVAAARRFALADARRVEGERRCEVVLLLRRVVRRFARANARLA